MSQFKPRQSRFLSYSRRSAGWFCSFALGVGVHAPLVAKRADRTALGTDVLSHLRTYTMYAIVAPGSVQLRASANAARGDHLKGYDVARPRDIELA